jgi:hypothetical protein
MRADTLRGQVGGGWALETKTFLAPMKWHRAVRRVPFGAQKCRGGIDSFELMPRLLKRFKIPSLIGRSPIW